MHRLSQIRTLDPTVRRLSGVSLSACQLFVVCGLWLSAVSCQLSAAMGQQEVPTQGIPALANVQFKTDVRVFTVMAAINAAGFDYETPDQDMSEVRQQIRAELQDLDTHLADQLKTFYQTHQTAAEEVDQQAGYISLALSLSAPPDFRITASEEEMPPDVWRLRAFERLLQEFYEKANLGPFWQRYEPHYEQQLFAYQPVMQAAMRQSLSYFRTPLRIALDRRIVLIPDLLNAKNTVNARNLEQVYYIVLGPRNDPAGNYRQLQHEYLHILVDPLVEKFGSTLLKHRNLLDLALTQPFVRTQFQDRYLLVVTESLIEAILLRLHRAKDLNLELVRFFREGLIFAPYFERALRTYENNDLLSFPAYAETVFQGINDSEIEKDEKTIAALENDIKTERERRLAAEQKAREELARKKRLNVLLNEAGVFISKQEYKSAGQKIDEILQEDANNGNALFYLAQIASQTGNHEKAFDYYSQASSAPSTPLWVRAWSLLRAGKYLAYRREFEKARIYFDSVIKMDGELRGAREDAQQSLGQLPQAQ